MSIRRDLFTWQWSIYPGAHRDRVNLVIHLVTMPLFWLGAIALIAAIAGAGLDYLVAAAVLLLIPVAAQNFGHKREGTRPAPFLGFGDFLTRFTAEQLVTLPRFVASGGWRRNLAG